MGRLAFYLRLYGLLAGKYIQARMQYRADFLISTLGILAGNLASVAALGVVFQVVPRLAGYSFGQILFLYGFAIVVQSPMQILFDNLWALRMHTNQGTFIRVYFKPLPTMFTYVAEMVDLKGFGQLAFGIGALVWASVDLHLDWTPLRIALFPVLLTGGALIFVSIMTLAASATFWIKDSFSIMAFFSAFRDHARYPMGIYNSFFQVLFTWILPIGFIAWYPAQFYLTDTLPDATAWASPLLGAGLFAVAVAVWNRGTRHWAGTGS